MRTLTTTPLSSHSVLRPWPAARRLNGPAQGARQWWLWAVFTLGAAVAGAWGSASAPGFYAQLSRPDWAPPASLFGPAWTVLYLLMAVAACGLARLPSSPSRNTALALFAAHLVFNALWSWTFFAWHQGLLALTDASIMWLTLAGASTLFWQLRPGLGALLVLPLAWVSFAWVLNLAIWLRNPLLLG